LRRYLTRLSPLTDVRVADGSRLCATDLAKRTRAANAALFHYEGWRYTGWPPKHGEQLPIDVRDADEICVAVPSRQTDDSVPLDDPSRYVIVDLANGAAKGNLRVHLYDLGSKLGVRIVGIERPSNADAP
jgi:hypothetical protein